MTTNQIEAVMIDSREPEWVQKLTFGGAPTVVQMLETGDVQAVTSDGCLLVIERKTPDDFLGSLRDERLLLQMARMAEMRLDDQLQGTMHTWPYLVITGELRNVNGKLEIDGRGATGWSYDAVQGALLSIQEMGVFVVLCRGDADFEPCVMRLAGRKRDEMKLLPARPAVVLGPGANFLAGLPGIGVERVMELLRWGANVPAHVLCGLVDLSIATPQGIGEQTRKKIRHMLGLKDRQVLSLMINPQGDEVLKVYEEVGG